LVVLQNVAIPWESTPSSEWSRTSRTKSWSRFQPEISSLFLCDSRLSLPWLFIFPRGAANLVCVVDDEREANITERINETDEGEANIREVHESK
jgi:hypothetical protein